MRIALVGSDPVNGLLYYPARLAVAFRKLGHEVELLAGASPKTQAPGLAALLAQSGVAIHRDAALDRVGWRALAGGKASLRRTVRALRPDVLHAHGPVSLAQAAPLGRAGLRRVAMVSAMGHTSCSPWPARFGAALLAFSADLVLALCDEERERLTRAGVARRKLDVVYNPLDCDDVEARAKAGEAAARELLDRAGVPAGAPVVVALANFKPVKRHDLILEVFARAAPREAFLVLGGEGAMRADAERRASQPDLRGRVVFAGRLQADAALGLLRTATAAVHASVAETFGYSMVEPLLLGCPAVVTRVGFGREIAEADAAVVVPPGDGDALARGLAAVLSGASENRERVRRAAAWVRRELDVAVIAGKLIARYQCDK